MDKSLSLGVVIGATVAASFPASIGAVKKQFTTLGNSIKELSSRKGLIERFEKDQAAVEKARITLGKTQKEVQQLKLALRKNPGGEGTAKALEKTQNKAAKLGATLDRQRSQLRKSEQAMRKAGISVKGYAAEYTRLGQSIEKAQAKQAKMQRAMNKKNAAGQRLSDMRGQMMGGAGLLYGAGRMIGGAADFGRQGTRLSTVINSKDIGKAVAESRRHALKFARNSLANETEILEIEYALNSAGLDAQTARIGSELVHKIAKVTDGVPERVGEVVATTFNNLGSQLEGTAEEKMARIGDLLTKTQFKFQLRDFNQLGESMKMATPALAQYNVNLEQGVTLIGALNSAGMAGSMAGTALSATFRNLSKASEELGFEMVRDAKGGLDFIATLENMSDAIGGFEGMDQQTIDELQKLFGDEGIRMVSLLGPKLKDLAAAQKEVAGSSKGIVDASYQRFMEDSRGQIDRFVTGLRTIGLAFAGTLLPAVNAFLKPAIAVAGWIGEMIEEFPAIGVMIGGAVVGFGLLQGGLLLATAAQWAFNAAALANPIGLVVAGIAGAAALVIHYWEPITDFFKGLWDGIGSIFNTGVGYLQTVWDLSPLGLMFKAADKIAGFVGEMWDGGKKVAAGAAVGAALATNVAAASSPALASSQNSSMVNAPITINAAPGMDAQAIAEEVDRKLREREQQAGVKRRGAMDDY